MRNSPEILADLKRLGFDFRIKGKTKHYKNSLEIYYDGQWYFTGDKDDNMTIWAIVRSKLSDIGYTGKELIMARQVIIANAGN